MHSSGPKKPTRRALRPLLGLAARALSANARVQASPWKITWALTYWCQYRCQTCDIWKKRPEGELDLDEIVRFLRTSRSPSWLDLTGGEIFLRPDLDAIFDALLEHWRGLAVLHFPTNGYLTRKIVPAVESLAARFRGRLVVTVSLDGDEETNDRIRGVEGGFRHQIETFRALRTLDRVQAVLGVTLSAANAGSLARTFAACREEIADLSPAEIHLNIAQLSGHYYSNAGKPEVLAPRSAVLSDLDRYQALRGRSFALSDQLERRFLREMRGFLETGRTPMRCHALRSTCFIDPWGTVFPCITYSRPLGRLRERGFSLDAIWNDAQTRATQAGIWEGDCPQCWTACEAYPSILGNLLRPARLPATEPRLATGPPQDMRDS